MDYVLQTEELSKHYKTTKALDRLTMHVEKGSIYGFVGRNGAGKTTLIRHICGLQTPTSGSFTLYGCPNTSREICRARRRIGAVVETPSIYLSMTAEENLRQQYQILGLPSYDGLGELLELVRLQHTGKKKARDFSLGMRQRLGIAVALAGDPGLPHSGRARQRAGPPGYCGDPGADPAPEPGTADHRPDLQPHPRRAGPPGHPLRVHRQRPHDPGDQRQGAGGQLPQADAPDRQRHPAPHRRPG